MLDLLYARAVAARRRWFERHPDARRRLQRPVISIGNLSVGGTGKTPMVSLVARWLVARGERPAILSRGYGRRVRRDGAVVVSDGRKVVADLDHAGDEPLMLARAVPEAAVVVSEDRYLAGVLSERHLNATVHILDDGFQHVQLARTLDVLMTTVGEITNGRVLPWGRLRESIDAASRAHVVVVLDTDAAGARSEAWALGISQSVAARRRLVSPSLDSARPSTLLGATLSLSKGRDGPEPVEGPKFAESHPRAKADAALAVAGIAHPDHFFQMLREAGHNVVGTMAFPDHHRYGTADVARVQERLRAAGAETVLTTEKDLVRWEALAPLPFTCMAVPLTLELDDWDTLGASIEQALQRAREAA